MILTFGTTPALARSMTFERVAFGDVSRAAEVHVAAAGKATNAARVIATLGEPVVTAGFVGGHPGDELLADLRNAGIEPLMLRVAAPTRVCITVIDRAAHNTTELIQNAAPITPAEVDALKALIAPRWPTCACVLGLGSLAPGVPASVYRDLVRHAHATHPSAIAIVDATGESLRLAVEARGIIVKCNADELRSTFSDLGESVQSIARSLIEFGVRGVLATDGVRPTFCGDAAGFDWIQTPAVEVVSPIGSGDSVAGGLSVGLTRGMPFLTAARLGVACGAANAMTPTAGAVDPAVVERLFESLNRTT